MASTTAPTRTSLFTISREKLLEALAAIAPATPTKSTLPVLTNVLVESINGRIRFSATDLDIFVAHEVAADVTDACDLTIPAKRLQQIAKELPPAPVRFSRGSKGVVHIECGRASFRLHTLAAEEFPKWPDVGFGSSTSFSVPANELQTLAKRTTFATSRSESRPILNGVLVEISNDRLRFVASNGHLLALHDRPVDTGTPGFEVIVPPDALDHVTRLFSEEDEVDIAKSDNHLGFRNTTTTIITRLIEGPYPPYERIIPKNHPRLVKVDRLSLISAFRRVAPVADSECHRIKVSFDKSSIRLASRTPDIGDAKDEITATLVEGETESIGVNASYTLDVLNRLAGDEVHIRSGARDRALIFEPAVQEELRSLYLVMPLRLLED